MSKWGALHDLRPSSTPGGVSGPGTLYSLSHLAQWRPYTCDVYGNQRWHEFSDLGNMMNYLYYVAPLSTSILRVQIYKLSAVKMSNAALCLTNNPTDPKTVCMATSSFASRSSLNGPLHTSHKFKIVIFVVSITCPSVFLVTRVMPVASNAVTNKL